MSSLFRRAQIAELRKRGFKAYLSGAKRTVGDNLPPLDRLHWWDGWDAAQLLHAPRTEQPAPMCPHCGKEL